MLRGSAVQRALLFPRLALAIDGGWRQIQCPRRLGDRSFVMGNQILDYHPLDLGHGQAFENLAYRVALDHIKGVVTTMIQTEKYGTPLASALRVLSAEFRNDRMMRAEEKAARLPAIMTIPLILFILPVLFIVILGPAACSISDALL